MQRGLPLDSLLRAYHIGQATFFRRWSAKAHDTVTDPHELTEAVELGANWTFDYVEKLSDGLVQRYGEERERWVRSAAAARIFSRNTGRSLALNAAMASCCNLRESVTSSAATEIANATTSDATARILTIVASGIELVDNSNH